MFFDYISRIFVESYLGFLLLESYLMCMSLCYMTLNNEKIKKYGILLFTISLQEHLWYCYTFIYAFFKLS
jgi:hypothetical protein